MDRPSANDEHTTSDDGPKRERPTAAAPITSSVFPSTNQEHSIPSTSTFMARHPQQPANSTQAESPPPILPNLGLSKVPATSSSTIEEKDVADADGDEEEPRPRLFTGTSLPADIEPQRSVTLDPRASTRRPRSGIDWIVPVDEKVHTSHVHQRPYAYPRFIIDLPTKSHWGTTGPCTHNSHFGARQVCAQGEDDGVRPQRGDWAASPSGVFDDGLGGCYQWAAGALPSFLSS
jgi:hypothetical protein